MTALAIIGLLILITACINFINLATAQAIRRSKEVGIRKVLGSSRMNLITQFLFEAFVITLVALAISLGLTELMLLRLMDLVDFGSRPELIFDGVVLAFLVGVLVFTTLLSGLYPAMVLSNFRPVQALKSKIPSRKWTGYFLRRTLVATQFGITQILIFGTLVITSQMRYFTSKELGFEKEGIVITPLADSVDLEYFRNRLMEHSGISQVSFALGAPSSTNDVGTKITYREFGESPISVALKFADVHYLDTYQIKLLAGRNLWPSDSLNHVLVNRALVETLALDEPEAALGVPINFMGKERSIIGVVEDFHMVSFEKEIDPMVLANYPDWFYQVGIKVKSQDLRSSLEHIQQVWSEAFPEYVFDYKFLDQEIGELYREEQRISQIFQFFAGTAILIGCLGLFGLISFVANNKTKEIGIRKTLGATVFDILAMFSREFTRLTVIGFIISAPIAYLIFDQWLDNFAYHIHISPWIFIWTFVFTLAVAALTVGYQSVRSAIANPVDSLQYE